MLEIHFLPTGVEMTISGRCSQPSWSSAFALPVCPRRGPVSAGHRLSPIVGVLSAPFSVEFFLGIAAAYLLFMRTIPRSDLILILGVIAFAIAAATEVAEALNGYRAMARLAYGLPSMAIVLGLVELERSGRLRVPRPLAVIGRASYAVYLVHLIVIGVAFKVLSGILSPTAGSAWLWWIALAALAVFVGVLASRWLEQPSIRFFRRRLGG